VQFVLVADGSFRCEAGAVWGFADAVGAALVEAQILRYPFTILVEMWLNADKPQEPLTKHTECFRVPT
jgi:hypothetical protein